jgi:hypothetical protein
MMNNFLREEGCQCNVSRLWCGIFSLLSELFMNFILKLIFYCMINSKIFNGVQYLSLAGYANI